jgi:hypothetical protein
MLWWQSKALRGIRTSKTEADYGSFRKDKIVITLTVR